MQDHQIVGLKYLKKHLQTTVSNNRVAHAQLFVAPAGSGALPLALYYAGLILCKNQDDDCIHTIANGTHPDLHFAFPVAKTPQTSEKPRSDDFMIQWREFLVQHPYGAMEDWYQAAEIEQKNCEIRVQEAADINRKLSLKSYQGGAKVCIIWGAEFINVEASNKLLKLIEEPPSGTVLILITEDQKQIINTVRSRCQVLQIPKLTTSDIAQALVTTKKVTEHEAQMVARQSNGSFGKALKLLDNTAEDQQFEEWFVSWVRAAFMAKGRPEAIIDLMQWAETLAGTNRETQKRFLLFSLEFFRQAMLINYKANSAVYLETKTDFDIRKFAPFIDGHRLPDLSHSLENALFHLERNASPKIVFSDLSIGMTKILHKR